MLLEFVQWKQLARELAISSYFNCAGCFSSKMKSMCIMLILEV